MDLYEAIHQMRELTEKNIPFSFSFMSYSEEKDKSHGIVEVNRAKLRRQSRTDNNKNADIMLNFYDLTSNEYGQCYQPLLIEFNGELLELN